MQEASLKRQGYDPQQIHELERELVRNSLNFFVNRVFFTLEGYRKFQPNWHIECICEHLQAVVRGDINRLNINIPPRYMKSVIGSIAFPMWTLGNDPSKKVICLSYSAELAGKFHNKSRTIARADWYQKYFPDCKVVGKSSTFKTNDVIGSESQKRLDLTKGGSRYCTSIGGTLTGEGADFIVIDDSLDPQKAASDTERKATNNWITDTVFSRLDNAENGGIVNIQQRLHTEDTTGMLLDKGFENLVIPIEADKTYHYLLKKGRKHVYKHTYNEGEILQEARHGKSKIEELKRDLGSYAFAGQYMQQPVPIGGGMFKRDWIQFYDVNDMEDFSYRNMNIYILVDPATSKKKNSDFTAIMVVGLANDQNYYVLDMKRERWNPTERINGLWELHKYWSKKGGKPAKVGYEKYGMMTDTFFIDEKKKFENYRFPLVELGGNVQKEERVSRLIPIFETERMYFPKTHITYREGKQVDLVKEFIEDEYAVFPVGKHDDMIDALARIMDEKLFASFPKLNNIDYNPTERTKKRGFFRKSNFMTW